MPASPLFSLSVKNLYGFLPPGTSLCLNEIDFHYHLVWHSFGGGRLSLEGDKTDARIELRPLEQPESLSELWVLTLPQPLK